MLRFSIAAPDFAPGKELHLTQALFWTAAGTGFTLFMTVLGSATVFIFGRKSCPTLQRMMLGFAAGVMISSSIWSLLIPAIQSAQNMGLCGWLPASAGFLGGALFLLWMEHVIDKANTTISPVPSINQSFLLSLAITMHNVPEGMAVGVSFALAAQGDPAALASAAALALGVGIQNFPEGAAVSLPLCQDGMPPRRAFAAGAASGIAEPAAGLLTVLVAGTVHSLLPWLLSFAAGAMLYVVVEELIPQANPCQEDRDHAGTIGILSGFLIMMVLDVALG